MKKRTISCPFCNDKCFYRYNMGQYEIHQCQTCKTGQAYPFPCEEELKKYYDGFKYQTQLEHRPNVEKAARAIFVGLKLPPNGNAKMLDVGGGGGYFSEAFEKLGYGESTYMDLDPKSCSFAREHLGLRNVVNCDVGDMGDHIKEKFDLIYCRHVIEHLIEPVKFLNKALEKLANKGTMIIQVPNGRSLEYLAYPRSNIRERFGSIKKSNNFSDLKVLWTMVNGGMLHGIDPPRHIWAITSRGMKEWAKTAGVDVATDMYNLAVKVYSPYYVKGPGLKRKVQDFLGQYLLSSIHGGTHLVARITK